MLCCQKSNTVFLRKWVKKTCLTRVEGLPFSGLSMCLLKALIRPTFQLGSFVQRPKRPRKVNTKLNTFYKLSYAIYGGTLKYLFLYSKNKHFMSSFGFSHFTFSFFLNNKKERSFGRISLFCANNKEFVLIAKEDFHLSANNLDSLLHWKIWFIILFMFL